MYARSYLKAVETAGDGEAGEAVVHARKGVAIRHWGLPSSDGEVLRGLGIRAYHWDGQ